MNRVRARERRESEREREERARARERERKRASEREREVHRRHTFSRWTSSRRRTCSSISRARCASSVCKRSRSLQKILTCHRNARFVLQKQQKLKLFPTQKNRKRMSTLRRSCSSSMSIHCCLLANSRAFLRSSLTRLKCLHIVVLRQSADKEVASRYFDQTDEYFPFQRAGIYVNIKYFSILGMHG
jgi:hypothetical protein